MPQKRRRGRGEHSIYCRTDGRAKPWVLSVSGGVINGRRRRSTYYFSTKREAQAKLRELTSQDLSPNRITLATYQSVWLDDKRGSVSPATILRYDGLATILNEYLGSTRLQEIEATHVRTLFADMRSDGHSSSNLHHVGTQLRAVLRQAVADRLINYNAAEAVRVPRRDRRLFQPLSMDQIGELLAAAEFDRLHGLYSMALHTGCRTGEIYALQWSDIDFTGRQVSITKTLEQLEGRQRIKEPKTKASRRTIILPAVLIDVLHEHRKDMLREGNGSAPAFCSTNGKYLRPANVHVRHWKPTLERAGLPHMRLHDLRHQAASMWLSAGLSIKAVSARLGHESVKITLDSYAHLMPADDQTIADKIDQLFRSTGCQ